MKLCRKCKTEKEDSEFHKQKHHKDGLASYCKPCAIAAAQSNNRKDLRKVACRAKDKRRKVFKLVESIKESYGCCLCGEKCGCCLSFHHINDDKDVDVSTLVLKKNIRKLFLEMNKCVVVCENCHRKVHRGILSCYGKSICSINLEDYFDNSFGRLYIKGDLTSFDSVIQ